MKPKSVVEGRLPKITDQGGSVSRLASYAAEHFPNTKVEQKPKIDFGVRSSRQAPFLRHHGKR